MARFNICGRSVRRMARSVLVFPPRGGDDSPAQGRAFEARARRQHGRRAQR